MRVCRFFAASVAVFGVSLLALSARADDKKQDKSTSPPAAKPSKEHGLLAQLAGTWDAAIKEFSPGQAPTVSKGTEVSRLICNGLWLTSDFKGSMAGQEFSGHGLYGYDPEKKKIVGTWVDSMSTSISLTEGSFDADGKVMTMTMEAPGLDGKPAKWKMVTTFVDKDHHTFVMSLPGADGKEFKMMEIEYTRKKK